MRKFKIDKKVSKRLAALSMAGMIFVSSIGLSGCTSKEQKEQITINQIHSENGIESEILKYIDISKKLEDLNLEEYILDEEVKGTPDSLSRIEKAIQNYDEKNVTNLRYLMQQEKLVNKYIYEIGYEVAYNNASEATKNCVAELYDLSNPENITISYYNSHDYNYNNESNEGVYITYGEGYMSMSVEVTDKDIILGARVMANTQLNVDPDLTDNSLYNKDRNIIIKNALLVAHQLNNKVDNEELYDEKEALKLLKK